MIFVWWKAASAETPDNSPAAECCRGAAGASAPAQMRGERHGGNPHVLMAMADVDARSVGASCGLAGGAQAHRAPGSGVTWAHKGLGGGLISCGSRAMGVIRGRCVLQQWFCLPEPSK